MPTDHYDIIIVGAGPAGSCTARAIEPQRSGRSVLLLERRKQVGVPIQCGEAIPTYAELKSIFPDIDCPELFDFPPDVIAGTIEGLKLVDPFGRAYIAHLKGRMFHRDRLDQWLFDLAVDAGAEYRLHTRVRRIEGNRLVTDRGEYTADVIIGADGPQSIVSDSFPAFAPNRDLCPCSFVIAEGDFGKEEIIELWFQCRFPGGYFWLFPKNRAGQANIGLGVRGYRVRKVLDEVLAEIEGQRRFRVRYRGGGVVPLGGLKKRLAWRNVALVGDAAGMVFPSNGGGTGLAMAAGKMLGTVLRLGLPLEEYERRARSVFGKVLRNSLRVRRQMDLVRHSDRGFAAVMWLANLRGWRSFIIG